jgi:N2227-like protein
VFVHVAQNRLSLARWYRTCMPPGLGALLGSDSLLGLVLVLITFFSLRTLLPHLRYPRPIFLWDSTITRAAYAFSRYERVSRDRLADMRNTYLRSIRFNPSHKRISIQIRYPEKLRCLEHAIQANAIVTRGIFRLAEDELAGISHGDSTRGDDDLVRVRESLKHFVRDWSAEGKPERDQAFTPILDILTTLERDPARRENKHALIPGSGLGRLAWEVSRLRQSSLRATSFSSHRSLSDPMKPQGSIRLQTSTQRT